MRQTLQDLCAILEQQRDVLKSMLALAKEERQILVAADKDKLEPIIRSGFKELNRLGSIEKKRLTMMDTVAAELGIEKDGITVSQIAERAEPDEQGVIRELQEEITHLVNEHTIVNKENRSLIEAHVEYSQMILEMMVGSEDPLNNMYGNDGRAAVDRKKTTGLYDGHA